VFPKTSGSKGLQLYVPMADVDAGQARERAHSIAISIEKDHPEAAVSNMRKDLRKGKVLIDWSQNHPAKTTVCVYSLRARPEPTVSAPVTWEEVDACARKRDPVLLRFEAPEVLDRVGRHGDLMEGLLAPSAGA
jgi:bifunctional non-homologous end joining protein LigD